MINDADSRAEIRYVAVDGQGWADLPDIAQWIASGLHDHASDRLRLQELRENCFACWRALAREQLEDAGQHELLNWVVLAGAMTELGHKAQIIDFVETHVFNSNKCFASFRRMTGAVV